MTLPKARDFFSPTGRLDDAAQAELESQFFRVLRLPNGTYKTTYANRMPDVDRAVGDVLLERVERDASQPVRILDVGVSSGITTLELVQSLESRGIAREVTAVDIAIHAALVRRAGLDVLLDAQGRVLQVATPFGVRGRPHDPEGSMMRGMLQRFIDTIERLFGGAAGVASGEPVRLASPRLLARSDVRLVEHDITVRRDEWRDSADVVRAANILNYDYFPEATLRTALDHLRGYARVGGLLCVCRTDDSTRLNHATIFVKQHDGTLLPVQRIGRGSEIEPLAVALAPSSGASAA